MRTISGWIGQDGESRKVVVAHLATQWAGVTCLVHWDQSVRLAVIMKTQSLGLGSLPRRVCHAGR